MKQTGTSATIGIIGEHPIFRDILESLINRTSYLSSMHEIWKLHQKPDVDLKHKPDVLLIDGAIYQTSGINALEPFKESYGDPRIIVLVDSARQEDTALFLEVGAKGIVSKESASSVLISAIKAVLDGKYWIRNKAVSRLDGRFKKSKNPTNKSDQSNYGLTPREMDVIRAVISGLTNREIAQKLAISEQTVKHHITNIFDKLGVYNRLELTLFVFHHGLVEN